MKFYLVDGEVKFLTHKIEWSEIFYDVSYKQKDREFERERMSKIAKDSLVTRLSEKEITPIITEVLGEMQIKEFYNIEQKDNLVAHLDEREIEYAITDYEQPTQEILDSVQGKKFNTIVEAQQFLDGTLPKSDAERIDDLELLVLQLGGII